MGCVAAGLFVWEDATLAGLFQTLAMLHEPPDPVALLESLLTSPGSRDTGTVDGRALLTEVSALRAD